MTFYFILKTRSQIHVPKKGCLKNTRQKHIAKFTCLKNTCNKIIESITKIITWLK